MKSRKPEPGAAGGDRVAKEAILKLARALARKATREDHQLAENDWRKKPRKKVLRPPKA